MDRQFSHNAEIFFIELFQKEMPQEEKLSADCAVCLQRINEWTETECRIIVHLLAQMLNNRLTNCKIGCSQGGVVACI